MKEQTTSMSQQDAKGNSDQLIRDGYCLVEDGLDADILHRLRQVTDQPYPPTLTIAAVH